MRPRDERYLPALAWSEATLRSVKCRRGQDSRLSERSEAARVSEGPGASAFAKRYGEISTKLEERSRTERHLTAERDRERWEIPLVARLGAMPWHH